jgi:CheY-like chemotaxis protein/anti-sigma regulatory factor (Ser/Thr protein kinase)
MSHEIRTPMNAIIGMAELALREPIPDEAAEMVADIRAAGNSLLAIINDILDFSKIESGKMEIIAKEFHFASLIHDAISVIGTRLAESPLELLVEVDGGLPGVMTGDEVRLRQILLNLLTNAVKYTEKGSVRLRIEASRDDRKELLSLSVKDTGKGIRPEDTARLFGDFAQFDKAANRGIEGTGLGLAISRNLAHLMGGDITFSSVYGEGSEFVATVALESAPAAKPLAALKNPSKISIVLLEPNAERKSSLLWTLERLGPKALVEATMETLPEILAKEGASHVIAPESERPGVLAAIKGAPKPPHAVFILADASHANLPRGVSAVSTPAWCLPLADVLNDKRPSSISRAKMISKAAFTAPKAKALVVDDVEINLRVVKGLLAPFKLQVDLCSSGQESVDKASKKRYDLILMDHMMPGMDGLEATRRIRSLPGGSSIPIVALTANAVSGIKEMFLENGMSDFISKPIEVRKLQEILAKWIPKNKLEKAQDSSSAPEATDDPAMAAGLDCPPPGSAALDAAAAGGGGAPDSRPKED